MNLRSILPILVSLACLPARAQTPVPAPGSPPAYEMAPLFQASEVLDPSLLAGPYHRVRESAYGDGYLVHFTIDSDFGTYECVGIRDLRRCVWEIQAIASLVAVSKGDLFAEGLRKSVEAPIDAVKNIVTHPGKSVKQVPHTVGHFFNKLGTSLDNAARKSAEGKQSSPGGEGKGIGDAFKSVAGFDKAKLECARQLGVDPYSDNPRLQEEMEKVTWAFFAGGLPLRIGAAVVSTGASVALTATEVVGLPEDIYDVTPSELKFQDRKALEAMGMSPQKIDAVFANPNVSISVRHQMVRSLARLNGPGREEIINVIISCDTSWRAHFFRDVLRLLEKRGQIQPYTAYGAYGRLAVAQTADGTIEVPAPVDYVIWSEEVAGFANRVDLTSAKHRLILQGQLSERAASELKAAGWEIVPLP